MKKDSARKQPPPHLMSTSPKTGDSHGKTGFNPNDTHESQFMGTRTNSVDNAASTPADVEFHFNSLHMAAV
jgi:hypothetical protein